MTARASVGRGPTPGTTWSLSLADFNLAACHGGFGRAARRPKATLSRRVAELEASLGVRLLERGTRPLLLTEEGCALQERTSALLGEIDEVAEAIASGTAHPRDVLRISAPVLFAHTVMGRLAAGFAALYSDVRLSITAEGWVVDMEEEGYDHAVAILVLILHSRSLWGDKPKVPAARIH